MYPKFLSVAHALEYMNPIYSCQLSWEKPSNIFQNNVSRGESICRKLDRVQKFYYLLGVTFSDIDSFETPKRFFLVWYFRFCCFFSLPLKIIACVTRSFAKALVLSILFTMKTIFFWRSPRATSMLFCFQVFLSLITRRLWQHTFWNLQAIWVILWRSRISWKKWWVCFSRDGK